MAEKIGIRMKQLHIAVTLNIEYNYRPPIHFSLPNLRPATKEDLVEHENYLFIHNEF